MGSPPWGWVPDASQVFTTFFSWALASWAILASSRAVWPHPSHLKSRADLTVSILQQNLLLQQFSRWGPWLCMPHRGIHFLTHALIFSVAVWHSLHFSPSSWAASRNFLHLPHQAASSTVAASQGTPGFFSPSCAEREKQSDSSTARAALNGVISALPIRPTLKHK